MKKIFLFLILVFFYSISSAQKTKTFPVCKTQLLDVSGRVSYNGEIKTDTSYFLFGRDSRYKQIDFIALKMCSLIEMYYFLIECRDAIKSEEEGVSYFRGDNKLSFGKVSGMKYINIFESTGSKAGYTQLIPSQINNILTGIEYFAKNHKVNLK